MSSSAALRLHAEIETPRPLHAFAHEVRVQGWCLAEELPEPPPVRLATAAGVVPLTERTARADVPTLFPSHPAAVRCGFILTGPLPVGVHAATLDAAVRRPVPGGRRWRWSGWRCRRRPSSAPRDVGCRLPARPR